ncbi:MAG: regulatory protein RecX [Candidatus Pelagibacter sp.]
MKKVEICSNINIFIIIDLKMFHQKNKKKNLEMTIDEMRNFAFIYIEKYAPSKQQLKTYLLKKYLNSKLVNVSKKNISDLIEIVTEDLEKTKFINDKFYSETKAKSLIQKGSSLNKIRNYLMNKGVGQKYIKYTLEKISHNNDDQDFFSAIKICKKRRIGPARNENNRPLFYKKDMGILARSGFDFEVSKRVLDISKDEYLKIINLF